MEIWLHYLNFNNCGLENFLNNEVALEEIIQESHVEGLKVVTSGQFFNVTDVFTSSRFQEFIEGISLRAEIVIIKSTCLKWQF